MEKQTGNSKSSQIEETDGSLREYHWKASFYSCKWPKQCDLFLSPADKSWKPFKDHFSRKKSSDDAISKTMTQIKVFLGGKFIPLIGGSC